MPGLGIHRIDDTIFDVDLYKWINVSAFFWLLFFNLTQYKKIKKSPNRHKEYIGNKISLIENETLKKLLSVFMMFLFIFCISSAQFFPGVILNGLVGKIFTHGSDNYFGFAVLAPVVLFAFFTLVRSKPFENIDIVAPAYPLTLIIFKIACYIAGCCNGKEWANGVYNHDTERFEHPVQLYELAIAAFIFLLLLIKKKCKKGTVQPLYLLLYCSTRFCTEFFRDDFPPIAGKLCIYHFMCIGGVIISIIEIIIISKYANRVDDYIFTLPHAKLPEPVKAKLVDFASGMKEKFAKKKETSEKSKAEKKKQKEKDKKRRKREKQKSKAKRKH